MNENRRKINTDGIRTLLHLIQSQVEAYEAGRIVILGHGRLSTNVPDDTVNITAEDIKGASNQGGSENDE